MKSGQVTFIADGGLMNFDVGFIPDYVELISAINGTELVYRFFRVLAQKAIDDGAAVNGQYGIADDGAGVLAPCASGSGFLTYEEGEDLGVLIEHPGSGKKVVASVADWLAATSYAAGERSATAIGTIVRPPTHNGYVYELTTDTAAGTSEPSSWPTVPGQTATDGGSNVWTCRLEEVFKSGGQGFAIQATISTDSEVWVARYVQDDIMEDLGDIDGQDPIRLERAKR